MWVYSIQKNACIQDGHCFMLDESNLLWKGSLVLGSIEKFIQLDNCVDFAVMDERVYALIKNSLTSEIEQSCAYIQVYNFDGKLIKDTKLNFNTPVDRILNCESFIKELLFFDSKNVIIYQLNSLI